jgi:hypothetical protein
LNLTSYLMATICKIAKKWNKIPTMHYLQVCFPVQMCSNGIQIISPWVPTQLIPILLPILAWCLTPKSYSRKMKAHLVNFLWVNETPWTTSMVGDLLPKWKGYQTNNIGMWPWPIKLPNIPPHINYIWALFGCWICLHKPPQTCNFLVKLWEDHSKFQNNSICVQLKRTASNRLLQNGSKTKLNFQCEKLILVHPPKWTFHQP